MESTRQVVAVTVLVSILVIALPSSVSASISRGNSMEEEQPLPQATPQSLSFHKGCGRRFSTMLQRLCRTTKDAVCDDATTSLVRNHFQDKYDTVSQALVVGMECCPSGAVLWAPKERCSYHQVKLMCCLATEEEKVMDRQDEEDLL